MLARQPGQAAARLLSTSAAVCARATKNSNARNGAAAPQQRPPPSRPPRRESSPYLELLARAPHFQNHPAYDQLVHELTRRAEKDLGRPLRPDENALAASSDDADNLEAIRNMVFERDPDDPKAPSPIMQEMLNDFTAASDTLDPDLFAGLSQESAEQLRNQLALKAELEHEAEEEAVREALRTGEELPTEEEKEEMRKEEEEEEAEEDEEDAEIESPFLEGDAHKRFNPLDLNNIVADPEAMSPVAFRMISIQRQFLHYMRLIEGDMFMLQGLRQPFQMPPTDHGLIIRTVSYGHEKHPVTRKRVIVAPVGLLPLDGDEARYKLKVLAGPRWTVRPPKDGGVAPVEDQTWGAHGYIKISIEDFPEPVQNLKFATDTLLNLCKAANDLEDPMDDIPIDERHVVAFYKRKAGYDKWGHRPSLSDFPVDWLHVPQEEATEMEELADAEDDLMEADFAGMAEIIDASYGAIDEEEEEIVSNAWAKWDAAREEALERGDKEAASIPWVRPPNDAEFRKEMEEEIREMAGEDWMAVYEQLRGGFRRDTYVEEEEDRLLLYDEDEDEVDEDDEDALEEDEEEQEAALEDETEEGQEELEEDGEEPDEDEQQPEREDEEEFEEDGEGEQDSQLDKEPTDWSDAREPPRR